MNFYQELGVLVSASNDDIIRAYKKNIFGLDETSKEYYKYKYIFNVLMNDYERGLYDAHKNLIKRDYDFEKYYLTVPASKENYQVLPSDQIFDNPVSHTYTYESGRVVINGKEKKSYEIETKDGEVIRKSGDPDIFNISRKTQDTPTKIEEIPVTQKTPSTPSTPSIEEIDGGRMKNHKSRRYTLVK